MRERSRKRPSPAVGAAMTVLCFLPAIAAKADPPGVRADITYASLYLRQGANIGDTVALQPAIRVDAVVPGLQLELWASYPPEPDKREFHEMDYLLKYNTVFDRAAAWCMDIRACAGYWMFPHSTVTEDRYGDPVAETETKGWKCQAGVALPRLLPLGGAFLVPGYTATYWGPEPKNLFASGFVHELTLSYRLDLREVMGGAEKENVDLSASLTYHDGAFGVEPGWSHATLTLALPFDFGRIGIVPTAGYQWSFEPSVNPEDVFWFTVRASFRL